MATLGATSIASEADAADVAIDARFTWTSRDTASPVGIGAGNEAYVSETFIVMTADDAGPFAKLGGRCIGSGTNNTATFAYTLMGSCEFKDADGDTLYETFEETSVGNGDPGIGKGEIVGGTGKFAGVHGKHDYETHFYASPVDGVLLGVGVKKGVWSIPAT